RPTPGFTRPQQDHALDSPCGTGASREPRGHEMKPFFRAMWPVRALRMAPLAGIVAAVLIASAVPTTAQQPNPNVRPPAGAVQSSQPDAPNAPGAVRPWNYDAEMWHQLRQGIEGKVSIQDGKAGRLVDSSGEAWRNFRNGPLPTYGAWLLAATLGVIALFFLIRGRDRKDR